MCLTSSFFSLDGPTMSMEPASATALATLLQRLLVFGSVTATHAVGFVMEVTHRVLWSHHQLVHVARAETQYTGLPVIDPDNGVVMAFHQRSPRLPTLWRGELVIAIELENESRTPTVAPQ